MDWDDLRYILMVGRSRTLLAAARALGVNQSTVYRRIRQIEERFGVPLFDRHRDGYTLTLAGENAMAVAEKVEKDMLLLEIGLSGRHLRMPGTVRVATTDALLIAVLTRHFAAFRRAHPEINLEVIVANEISNFSKRDADVAIWSANNPPETMVGWRLATIATAVYGHNDYLNGFKPSVQLSDYDWIGLDSRLRNLQTTRWFTRTKLSGRIIYSASNLLGILHAVRAGIGVAALPAYMVCGELDLKRISERVDALSSSLWLVTHPDHKRVPRIRVLMEFLSEKLIAQRQIFEE